MSVEEKREHSNLFLIGLREGYQAKEALGSGFRWHGHRYVVRKRQGAEMARPIGVDHFAGAGGMSLGSEQAGFDAVAAVKIDPIHAAVNKFKVPDCEVFARSVTDLTSDEIRKLAGVGNR